VVAGIFQILELRVDFLKIFEEFFLVSEGRLDFMIPDDLKGVSAMGAGIDCFIAGRHGLVNGVIFASGAFLPVKDGVDLFFDAHGFSLPLLLVGHFGIPPKNQKSEFWLCTKLQLTIYQDQKLAPQDTENILKFHCFFSVISSERSERVVKRILGFSTCCTFLLETSA
jgi:hypothetical protein